MTLDQINAAFLLSGIRLYAATPKLNTYPGMQTFHGPIWSCMTDLGTIQIGWRKRVIEIDWSDIGSIITKIENSPETGYDRWLTMDDTDQGATYVHSWGLQNLPKYLNDLRLTINNIDRFLFAEQ